MDNAESVCAHCGKDVQPDARNCRHGKLCGPCEWELDEWSGLHNDGDR